MRAFLLIPLLLLGCLQAAFWPAAGHEVPGAHSRIADFPRQPLPTPIENTTALLRLTEAAQQPLLPGAGKHLKAFLAPTPILAPEIASGANRGELADGAGVRSPLARPRNPRAPPASPLV